MAALTPDEWIGRVAMLPLIDQPGAGFHYGISTDLLGFLIARLDGESLGEVLARRVFAPLGMRDTDFVVSRDKRDRRAALCGFDSDGRLTMLTATPGRHALEERPDDMTFESGGQGSWSTVDDYLTFARMLLGDPDVPALLRAETRALMTSNQLTPEQRAATRMFGQRIFAAGHGYGMGVAVVLEPSNADPHAVPRWNRHDWLARCVRRLVAGRSKRSIGADLPLAQHARTVANGAGDRSWRVERDRELSRDRDVVSARRNVRSSLGTLPPGPFDSATGILERLEVIGAH